MRIKNFIFSLMLLFVADASAQVLSVAERDSLSAVLSRILEREVSRTRTNVRSARFRRGCLTIETSITLSYYPFREDNVHAMYDSVRRILPEKYRRYNIELRSGGCRIEDYIPAAFRSSTDRTRRFTYRDVRPLVEPLSRACHPTAGLENRHIAVWPSHGRYFDQKENVWRWQRTQMWQTCEDLLSQSFVVQYLVPMLENAGANVFLPRERDFSATEIIIDNDGGGLYSESDGDNAWSDGGVGFAHCREQYVDGQNPFTEGTYRRCRSVGDNGRESYAVWGADIPQRGEYAVYVSYKSVRGSCADAIYTVRHMGGESRFRVNQTMGGGTWICLGRFMLDAGRCDSIVMLGNRTSRRGAIVTADAVKIGGGYGNVARTVCDSLRLPEVEYPTTVSGMPRFCEGARYWLQWAGFPEEVYNRNASTDDYKDDYMCRAHWVNALMGGSERLPDEDGLGIPVDLALAFHTDGVVTDDDRPVGTLGIFFTGDNRGRFEGGTSRYVSRDLTDMVMTQLIDDIRACYESGWRRRGMWNRSYYEARVPCTPTVLLEMLSHTNFADMRYGADPGFRFTVARAIYKAILRHVAAQYGRPCVVAPLPVDRFSAELCGGDSVLLRWHGVNDSLESSAVPEKYVVYTRIGDGAFDGGRIVADTSCYVLQKPGEVYSYRVTAVNAGGESFPSETLSACRVPDERGRVMIINGFDRTGGPAWVKNDAVEGFVNREDGGVPYLCDVSFVGEQRVFDPAMRRSEIADEALGASYGDCAGRVVGGNTFDYPFMHGEAMAAAGYSYSSTSAASVVDGDVTLDGYLAADLILGKQRTSVIGRETGVLRFKTFPPELQTALSDFASRGGALFVSGSYVATDLWKAPDSSDADREFARRVLHCELGSSASARRGGVRAVPSPARITGDYTYNSGLSERLYRVEAPDALTPYGDGAFTVLRYAENNRSAGVACDGDNRSVVLGFPFESLVSRDERVALMRMVMEYLFRQGGTDHVK